MLEAIELSLNESGIELELMIKYNQEGLASYRILLDHRKSTESYDDSLVNHFDKIPA
ncbi:MAG: hypothetical protein ACJAS3_000617 [Roseivirga sp.]|jgi:hypothetical protein